MNNSKTPTIGLNTTQGALSRYDTLQFTVRITTIGSVGSAYGSTSIPLEKLAIGTTGGVCAYSAGRGDNQNVFLRVTSVNSGAGLKFEAFETGHDAYIHAIIGIRNPRPGEIGTATTTTTTTPTDPVDPPDPTSVASAPLPPYQAQHLSVTPGHFRSLPPYQVEGTIHCPILGVQAEDQSVVQGLVLLTLHLTCRSIPQSLSLLQ